MELADWIRLACYFFLIIVGFRIVFMTWPYRTRPSGFVLTFYGTSVFLGGFAGAIAAIWGDGLNGRNILTTIIVLISIVTYIVYRYLRQNGLPEGE